MVPAPKTAIAAIATLFVCQLHFSISQAFLAQENCGKVDFSKRLGPVRSQLDQSWCFAETAADLIGYHLHLTPKLQVSAGDLVATYYLSDLKLARQSVASVAAGKAAPPQPAALNLNATLDEMEKLQAQYTGQNLTNRSGGFENRAIAMANFKGICTETQLPLADIKKISAENNQGAHLMARLENHQIRTDECEPLIDPQTCRPGTKCFAEYYNALNETAVRKSLDEVESKCSPRVPFRQLLFATSSLVEGKTRISDMQAIIDRNMTSERPVSITYSHCFLLNLSEGSTQQSCEHASTVVGRRRNRHSGLCEYKIRDSLGTSCEQYARRYRKSCAGGQFWIGRDELMKHVSDVTQILPDNEMQKAK